MRRRATYRASDVQGYLPRKTVLRIRWTECAYTLAASAIVGAFLAYMIESI